MISNIKRIQLPCSIKRFDCGMGSNPDLKRLRYIYFVFWYTTNNRVQIEKQKKDDRHRQLLI